MYLTIGVLLQELDIPTHAHTYAFFSVSWHGLDRGLCKIVF